MANQILIVYGTVDGHTRKVAERMASAFRGLNASVDLFDSSRMPGDLTPDRYDGIVLAAPVHAHAYPIAIGRWARRHAETLNRKPSAFVSVCLAILDKRDETRQELDRILERFYRMTGWRPTVAKTVAGALPYTRYGFFKKWMMKRISARNGGDTDTTRDHEYTDWGELEVFAHDFLRRFAEPLEIQRSGAV